jgi:signal recognition particle receptor subunit beta
MKIVQDRIYLKVILFGSALAGKTTTLAWFFDHLIPEEMKVTDAIHSVKTSFGQTLLFDFVPIQAGSNITIRIYALTGQDYYLSTRRMFFEGVDGLFFIVDSQVQELEHNREFVKEFQAYRRDIPGLRDAAVLVLYNKQDLSTAQSPELLSARLGLKQFPSWPVSAATGANLGRAFEEMVGLILGKLRREEPSAVQ